MDFAQTINSIPANVVLAIQSTKGCAANRIQALKDFGFEILAEKTVNNFGKVGTVKYNETENTFTVQIGASVSKANGRIKECPCVVVKMA